LDRRLFLRLLADRRLCWRVRLDRRLFLRLLADRRLFFDQAWKGALAKVFYPLDPGGRGRLFDRVWKGQTAFGKVVFCLDAGVVG
jgi:hypothetical protein